MTAHRTSTPPRLLVVDDDVRYGRWLGHHLGVFCPDSSLSVINLTEFDRWLEADESDRDGPDPAVTPASPQPARAELAAVAGWSTVEVSGA